MEKKMYRLVMRVELQTPPTPVENAFSSVFKYPVLESDLSPRIAFEFAF